MDSTGAGDSVTRLMASVRETAMRLFRDIPIKQKLTRVIVLTSVSTLAVGCVAITVFQWMMFRHESVSETSELADLIARNISAAVMANRRADVEQELAILKANPDILAARVYRPDGAVLAEYFSSQIVNLPPPLTAPGAGQWVENNQIIVCRSVPSGNDALGTVCLRSDESRQLQQLRTSLVITVVAMIGAAMLAVLLSERLQRTISQPVQELARVARAVQTTQDYSLRARSDRKDELGRLTDDFNQMLAHIETVTGELSASEKRFRQVTETINEVFWMTDPQKQQMLYISPGYEKIWGRACEGLYREPMTWLDAIHPDDRERVRQAALSKQVAGNYDEQYRIVRPDGSVRWIRDRAFPIRDSAGKVYRVAGIADDITEAKRAEQALRLQSEITSNMAEGAVLVRASDATIVYANPKFERMFGYTPGELTGQPVTVVNAGDEAAARETARQIQASLKTTGTWSGQLRSRHKDGTEFWCWANIATFEHAEYGLVWIGVHTDITEWKLAEDKLRENAQRLRSVVTGAPVLLFALDRDGLIILEEGQAANLLGRKPGEVVGRNVFEVYAGHSQISDSVRRALAGEEFVTVIELPHAAFETHYTPVRGADGRVDGVIGVAHDVTKLHRLERQILEISDREQQRIGQDLHDGLCQLLTGLGFAAKALEERLAARSLPEVDDARGIVQLIAQANAEARNVARGLQPVQLEAGGLSSALHELAYSVESLFNISCSFSASEPVLLQDNAAAVQAYRIAQEAINNSIKHGQAKRIAIRLSKQNGQVTLLVTDDGIGIATTGTAGQGMGLSIMAYRARMIGGTLRVQRGAAGGTEVQLTFQQA
jgi:PAS domain S-box-containing protein